MTDDNAPTTHTATANRDASANGHRAEIDLDAILAQRAEATGGDADTVSFSYAGQTWTCKHPMLADDEWREGLQDLDDNEDVARYYMGDEQYNEFVDAGGRSGYFVLALREIARKEADVNHGRPTRRSTSSAKRRKR